MTMKTHRIPIVVIVVFFAVLLFTVSCSRPNTTKDKLSDIYDQLTSATNYLDNIKSGISIALNESDVEKDPKFFVSALFKASYNIVGVQESLGEVRPEINNIIVSNPDSIKDELLDVYNQLIAVGIYLRDIQSRISIALNASDVEKDPQFFVSALSEANNDIKSVQVSLLQVLSVVGEIIAR